MPKIDDSLKADVVKWSAFYEHRIRNGSVSPRLPHHTIHLEMLTVLQKVIFHLEAFVAKFMRLYEGSVALILPTSARSLTAYRHFMGMDIDFDD